MIQIHKNLKVFAVIIGLAWCGLLRNGCGFFNKWDSKICYMTRLIGWNKLIFPYWHKFRKAGNYVDNYWVVVVKNAHDALVHGILQSAVSQQWFDELRSVFLHADAN